MSEGRDGEAARATKPSNGHTHCSDHTSATNGHSSAPVPTASSSAPPPPVVPFGPASFLSRWRARLTALWPLSTSSNALLASLLFLWLTLDPHRRPGTLRTMLTFGPSALVNELAHLALPYVWLPASYALYRRLQSDSAGQWQLRAAVVAHVLSAISLLSLTAKSLASRASFRYALLHPGQLTEAARRSIADDEAAATNASPPPATGIPLPAVISSLSPVTPSSATPSIQPPKMLPSASSTAASAPSSAASVWSADDLALIDRVGSMDAWRCVQSMLPVPALTRWKDGIRVDSSITYHVVDKANKRQHLNLDVYHPPSASPPAKPYPLVVYTHGGGWITGDKRWGSVPLIFELAHAGHVVVSVNYRLSPYVRFPAWLVDCKRAIAYAKAHAAEWHADADRTFFAGESAGGHLASLAALTANQPTYQPGFEQADTSCVGVIDLYGVHSFVSGKRADATREASEAEDSFFDFLHNYVLTHSIRTHPALYHAASPLSALTAALSSVAPPAAAPALPHFFCAHGTNDTLVPVEDTWRFFAALADARRRRSGGSGGEEAALDVCVDVAGASHAFNIVYSARTYALNDALGVWMRRVVRTMDERNEREAREGGKRAQEATQWRATVRAELDSGTQETDSKVRTERQIHLQSSL